MHFSAKRNPPENTIVIMRQFSPMSDAPKFQNALAPAKLQFETASKAK